MKAAQTDSKKNKRLNKTEPVCGVRDGEQFCLLVFEACIEPLGT